MGICTILGKQNPDPEQPLAWGGNSFAGKFPGIDYESAEFPAWFQVATKFPSPEFPPWSSLSGETPGHRAGPPRDHAPWHLLPTPRRDAALEMGPGKNSRLTRLTTLLD